jgi:hypothetical protein
LQKITGIGYLRQRNDGIEEYIIGDVKSIKEFLEKIERFLIFKSQQAKLIIKILDVKEKVKTPQEFIELCILIDQFKSLNYSKKRTILMEVVKQTLINEGFMTP